MEGKMKEKTKKLIECRRISNSPIRNVVVQLSFIHLAGRMVVDGVVSVGQRLLLVCALYCCR